MSGEKYWVWFSGVHGLRAKTRNVLLDYYGTPEALYFADSREYSAIEGVTADEAQKLSDKSLDAVSQMLAVCDDRGVRVITIQDAAYPLRLRNIYDPPAVLYVLGRLPLVDEEALIGMVGTRKATPYGIKMARQMGFETARAGGVVVTGLAAGIDSAAAEGALRGGGRCVGVLGTAIDTVYPAWNGELFADVAAAGALVSEYPPGAPTRPGNFPARNRIISGLSVGVCVIEAPKKSGALITADLALGEGRDVFAVPGNADAPACEGSNALIKDCAKAVTCAWDILEEYERKFPGRLRAPGDAEPPCPQPEQERRITPKPPRPKETGENFAVLRKPNPQKIIDKEKGIAYIDLEQRLSELSETQLRLISAMTAPSMHIDDIISLSGVPAAAALADMTILQLRGFVAQERGKRFTLNIKTK